MIRRADPDAVFGNVNYHKRQAEELRAQLEDLGSEHEFPRGNCITPSHLEEVIALKIPEKRAEAIAAILEDKSSVILDLCPSGHKVLPRGTELRSDIGTT